MLLPVLIVFIFFFRTAKGDSSPWFPWLRPWTKVSIKCKTIETDHKQFQNLSLLKLAEVIISQLLQNNARLHWDMSKGLFSPNSQACVHRKCLLGLCQPVCKLLTGLSCRCQWVVNPCSTTNIILVTHNWSLLQVCLTMSLESTS